MAQSAVRAVAAGYCPSCTLRRVRNILKKLGAPLLAIFLATVLAPSFAWEASADRDDHGHESQALAAHDAQPDASHATHQSGEDSHHHHGCAGHALGHLLADLASGVVFLTLDPESGRLPAVRADFSTRSLERLDRPPLTSALA